MTNPRSFSQSGPLAFSPRQARANFVLKGSHIHASNIAKFCYSSKQHFASHCHDTAWMSKRNINDVLADNLAYFMEQRKVTQNALAQQSGIGQTTISLYLHPHRRQPGKSGKIPSAKLTEVESLAAALGVEPWKLIRPMTAQQRAAYEKIEQAFLAIAGELQEDQTKRPAA